MNVDCATIRAMLEPVLASSATAAIVSTVSAFVSQIRQVLEASIPLGWICGEVSNVSRAGSGHLYFTLKDDRAQIRCTMWRNRAQLLPFRLEEGMQLEVRAQVTVYETRGDLQLAVEAVRKAGPGSLYEAFLRVRAKLESEGLLDAARRRRLPALPRAVGIVTSPAAAALRDVAATLKRRAPGVTLTLYPCTVQGNGAAEQIAGAIDTASRRAAQDGIEALIVCRGGGSLEDLWAFNQEAVARAVAACSVPVICGIGHETDTTLCDLVADVRAATPTAAAEQVSSAWSELSRRLPVLAAALQRSITRRVRAAQQRCDELQRRLLHPAARLARSKDKLATAARRLNAAASTRLDRASLRLAKLTLELKTRRPNLAAAQARLDALEALLRRDCRARLGHCAQRLTRLATHLDHLNPHATLQRGYAIVRDGQGLVVRDATKLTGGDLLAIQFAQGSTRVRVSDGEDAAGTTNDLP